MLSESPIKIALLHRYPADQIPETNAAFPYLKEKGIDVLTFKKFDRLGNRKKFLKSLAWLLYAPYLVIGKKYDVIYCDDSYPFYPALVKLVSPKSKVIIRIGDFHLMYYYSGRIYKILHFFEKLTWRVVDRIIAISEPMALRITGETGLPVEIVLDSVDPKDFPYRDDLNYGTVMFHGVLTRNKNVDILIESARKMPETEFIIIGDGPDRERLEYLAPANVKFKGWIPFFRVSRAIRNCAVGVALRTRNPGNDYVVTSPFLQYGIMGKPCLVTRRKVFENENYQWQFSNAAEFRLKLKSLLKRPEEGKKLRKYVLEFHHAEKNANRIYAILNEGK